MGKSGTALEVHQQQKTHKYYAEEASHKESQKARGQDLWVYKTFIKKLVQNRPALRKI